MRLRLGLWLRTRPVAWFGALDFAITKVPFHKRKYGLKAWRKYAPEITGKSPEWCEKFLSYYTTRNSDLK